MKSPEWKTYRTRFLVRAKQLSSALTFTDHLGRQHCGRKGDYLVESCDGVLSIAPRQIFEDIYVAMDASQNPEPCRQNDGDAHRLVRFEPLRIEKIKTDFRAQEAPRNSVHDRLPRVRKGPQPIRTSSTRFGLM